jgi:transcriptional regulator with XRE-family HTH domain
MTWRNTGGYYAPAMAQTSAERLADASRERRESLRITQPDAAKAGGIGVSTLRQVESATQPGGLSRKTSLGIDRALRWRPGSAARMLNGEAGAPDPLDTDGWPTTSGDWAAYVAKREREAEDAVAVEQGSTAAAEVLARAREDRERPRSITEFSDAELIAELARRLAEVGRAVTQPADGQSRAAGD